MTLSAFFKDSFISSYFSDIFKTHSAKASQSATALCAFSKDTLFLSQISASLFVIVILFPFSSIFLVPYIFLLIFKVQTASPVTYLLTPLKLGTKNVSQSNLALWATTTYPSINCQNLCKTSFTEGADSTISLVMLVKSIIFLGIANPGLTNSENLSTILLSTTFTAAISIILPPFAGEKSVVSISNTTKSIFLILLYIYISTNIVIFLQLLYINCFRGKVWLYI